MQFPISASNPAMSVAAEDTLQHLNMQGVRCDLPPMSQVLVMGDPYFNQLAQRSTAGQMTPHVVEGHVTDQI